MNQTLIQNTFNRFADYKDAKEYISFLRGCANSIKELIQDLVNTPYRLPVEHELPGSSEHDLESMFEHMKAYGGYCLIKNDFALQCLETLGYKTRYAVLPFSWREFLPYPKGSTVQEKAMLITEEPYLLTYIEVKIGDQWIPIDTTWNKELEPLGVRANSAWDGVSPTTISLENKERRIDPFNITTFHDYEKRKDILKNLGNFSTWMKDEDNRKKWWEFKVAFNDWVDSYHQKRFEE